MTVQTDAGHKTPVWEHRHSLSHECLPKCLSMLLALSEDLGTPPPSVLFKKITPKGIGKEGVDAYAQMHVHDL